MDDGVVMSLNIKGIVFTICADGAEYYVGDVSGNKLYVEGEEDSFASIPEAVQHLIDTEAC